jgi:hypothetical protein
MKNIKFILLSMLFLLPTGCYSTDDWQEMVQDPKNFWTDLVTILDNTQPISEGRSRRKFDQIEQQIASSNRTEIRQRKEADTEFVFRTPSGLFINAETADKLVLQEATEAWSAKQKTNAIMNLGFPARWTDSEIPIWNQWFTYVSNPSIVSPAYLGVISDSEYGTIAENGSRYGDISAATGRPKTVAVRSYYRKDGTYVRGHYRSPPR